MYATSESLGICIPTWSVISTLKTSRKYVSLIYDDNIFYEKSIWYIG